MARLGKVSPLSMEDEGYPISREVDGINIREVSNREGFQNQLAAPINCREEWTNSKTGKKTEPPEYARTRHGVRYRY